MLRARFIPTLLLKGSGLYKTVKFKNETYIGDPINAVRIFNDKAVDELILLDIDAHSHGRGPNFDLIADITSEAFVPLCYGGGVTTLEQIERLFKLGVEKIAINSAAVGALTLVSEASKIYGNQSIVVGIDVRKSFFGKHERFIKSAQVNTKEDPVDVALRAEHAGAGELMVYSVDRDGTMQGYDIALTRSVAQAVQVPVIACGGAGSLADMIQVIDEGHAASAAAGSLFVFQGKHRAVLITYPEEQALAQAIAHSKSFEQP
ncbi:MAG: AglZ/HisF2 family acetamidino modification protein [Roseateles asaccharophilus]|uniref:imidazole glycerol-phosphate synthase n=1 Tax=Roseateles asaccharophilus TaxID=582607 RepID=A0A4R6MZ37_9BURK|nr:AglZ/HisF2 family acetamidino modification protein [Roseateles asaccharophilus]MDN3545731.1 AglZ/HisF2 family acetamidino modification protein [Roseateles asaccharophilus]TDP07599.1 imidazole glycerol phosphate synthase subunit HisF [Roseateles asaccharophilus]